MMKKSHVVIIDYGLGNVASVKKAFVSLGADTVVTKRASDIEKATHIVLPGVGAFAEGMRSLRESPVFALIEKKVLLEGVPFLGICLGMQLLANVGYEFGTTSGLGWIPGEVVKLEPENLRLPHVGWNSVIPTKESVLFAEVPDLDFYFVHSFAFKPKNKDVITSVCRYGHDFVSTLQHKNIFATQFHPEKSQKSGLKLLSNFLEFHHA